MFKRKKRLLALGNKEGSILLTVMVIMTFATILAVGAMSFVQQASRKTFKNVNSQQAYYTASGCLETFVETIMSDENQWATFEQIATGTESTEVNLGVMGKCTIRIDKPATGMIKLTATATTNGSTERVVCHLKANTIPGDAKFDNAIELSGGSGAGYNNINIIGDMAGTNDTNSDPVVYRLRNSPTIYGNYFQYGSIESNNQLKFVESVSGKGVSLTATKFVYFSQNQTSISSQVRKENNSVSNFVNAGNAFVFNGNSSQSEPALGSNSELDLSTGIRPKDVDLFANGVVFGLKNPTNASDPVKVLSTELTALMTEQGDAKPNGGGNDYWQYGNIYCYSEGGTINGDMVADSDKKINITGDVLVEGDLYLTNVSEFNITGNLYVNGTIHWPSNASKLNIKGGGKLYNRLEFNKAAKENPLITYEDLSQSEFLALKTNPRAVRPTLTYDGTKFVYSPEDLLISTDASVSTISTDYLLQVTTAELGTNTTFDDNKANPKSYLDKDTNETINFDLIINSSCYIKKEDLNGINNILINVTETSGDIVLVFESGCALYGKNILVKNETKDLEIVDNKKPSYCYITIDTYQTGATGTVLDADGNIIDRPTGFKTNGYMMIDNLSIVDYDTWNNCLSYITIDGKSGGNKTLNTTNIAIADSYCPDLGFIIMLLTEETHIQSGNQNLIEATIFANRASMHLQNGRSISTCLSADAPKAITTSVIGSVIVEKLTTGEAQYINYCKPSSKSNLANLGGGGALKIKGYEISKYTNSMK